METVQDLSPADLLQLGVWNYSDWHVHVDMPESTIVFPVASHNPIPVPGSLVPFAKHLAGEIKKMASTPEGLANGRYIVNCLGVRLRIQAMSGNRFAARQLPQKVMPLRDLGFGSYVELEFMQDGLKNSGGLIIVAGATGSGKTTTVSSIMHSRLAKYGGYGIAIEDPPEFPLEGFHGAGYCESMDSTSKGYSGTLASALRCFPSGNPAMLLYGEVREPEAASELLRTGIDGHLVMSTLHSKDIETAISRLISLAEKDGESDPYGLLANSLKIIAHQKIIAGPDGKAVRQMRLLKVGEQEATLIREKNIKQLVDRASQQQRMNMNQHREQQRGG